MAYDQALTLQRTLNQGVIDGQEPPTLLLVEHEPVLTLTRRKAVRDHLLANPAALERLGIATAETDRGGDITYHGPGQLVAYPILKLADYGLNLSSYMRLLEQVVIDTIARWGIVGHRECGATGVWVQSPEACGSRLEEQGNQAPVNPSDKPQASSLKPRTAKLCAMGVRIRKNTTMHGLALNVTPDMAHFNTIVPCGLAGRPVISMRQLLGEGCPAMSQVKAQLVESMQSLLQAELPSCDNATGSAPGTTTGS